ncbi:protein POLLENLESS 3-LIKE 2 [Artemisia annua]|uniref:Protein POLLENLESS 3-LIKE 2 n=1 Tax=Artemisia annua TaxID=35608 RepID=A0A2U1KW60_ARTAN|nr:protein POLLENLESS 3-LIKE 2 [Artemisia annua]
MMQNLMNAPAGFRPTKSAPSSPAKPLCGREFSETRSSSFNMSSNWPEPFHVTHKVPVGDTPYVRAKNVQLVDKDPERAIPLFWAAINAGDRVDSALKDMAIVMKQQNRAEEAIEAIKSLRHRCSDQAQESLDNILLDLYKLLGLFGMLWLDLILDRGFIWVEGRVVVRVRSWFWVCLVTCSIRPIVLEVPPISSLCFPFDI